jgi:putative ABC transport system ATP-binding protein|uniref:ABC transporter ATP-binding protein n=1 Tax=Nitrospira cf. moscoviensis SBR1015 TaxID=96242 RepID=UPI000A3941B1|nr:ABC transporter ATP-binding protein [Nitrospira cf. moscoviensis SBR1015]
MISVQQVSMALVAAGQSVTILDRISFIIPARQSVAIIGPSGSGKSTLLGLMAGLDQPTSGAITLDGTDITTMTESRMAQFRREKIGYIFQSFHLIPTLTAIENVAVPLELSREKRAGDRAAELLASVGLSDRMGHYPVQLSGGEQQRVAVARAFACRPPILLADEPTGNLDSATGAQVVELLLSLHRDHGTTLVLVTHDSALAASMQRVLSLRDGRMESDTLPSLIESTDGIAHSTFRDTPPYGTGHPTSALSSRFRS